jgi:7-cyano-7-deazaguanine synthase
MYWALGQGWEAVPIEFDYHERPERERKACRDLCAHRGIEKRITVPVPFLRETADIPAKELSNAGLAQAPQGYIPLRNLIFYAISAHYAEIIGARYIVGGHTRTDCESFSDAGQDFWRGLNGLLKSAPWSGPQHPIEIVLPLIELDKAAVVRLGLDLGLPVEMTWSCYYDADRPCGTCESCIERAQALAAAIVAHT